MISPEVVVPVIFVLWILTLWLVKSFIVRRLKQWAGRTSNRWDDVFVESISFPANFLILASGLVLAVNLSSLPERVDRAAVIALQASVILAIVLFADRFLSALLSHYSRKIAASGISHGVVKGLVRGFVIGMGILIFLQEMGISITPLLASLGIGSLAVALALQDTLANFFAGIYVAVDKPVRVGDFVKLESGQEGYVTDIGWRSTRIRTLPNSVVIVPNSKLVGSTLTNYYLPDMELAVLVEVGVHYESDLRHVEKVTSEVAKEVMRNVQGGISTFEPFIRYHTFGDSSVDFTVILRGKEFVDQYLIKHEFIKLLHERYRKEGITIPFPIRTLEISKQTADHLAVALSSNGPR